MNFGHERELTMATIIEFPAEAASRRSRATTSQQGTGTILILPVVRIERETTATGDDRDPREGAAPSRRRRRR
jgi:hypothetical protein